MPILMVDFNAYFASVEQQLQPHLRGKPVAVVPVDAETTCCIAVSYEARAWGIKTGTLVAEARRVCPHLHIVVARPECYVRMHHRIVDVVERCIHIEEVASIDEMWGEVYVKNEKEGRALAQLIKQRLREAVGSYIRCSIGVGPNVFLAKVGTDLQKPDGFVYLQREDVPKRLLHLGLRDFCGIGRRMEERLARAGIKTVADLYATNKETLRRVWGGVEGARFYAMLRGDDVRRTHRGARSLGHSHVLPPESRNLDGAYAVGHILLQKAAMRLRHKKWVCGKLSVWVRWQDRNTWAQEIGVGYTANTMRLLEAYDTLWNKLRLWLTMHEHGNGTPKFLSIGVLFSDLRVAHEVTSELFEQDRRQERLCRAVDALNSQYRRSKILWGGAMKTRNAAPMRIAFSRVPDIDLEGNWEN